MKTYILITGASSGIGYEMAQQLAAKQYNLILTARNTLKLSAMKNELAEAFGVEVQVIPKDLSQPEAAVELFEEIQNRQLLVSHLVNNAGFGDYGNFIETSLEKTWR